MARSLVSRIPTTFISFTTEDTLDLHAIAHGRELGGIE